MGVLQAAFLLSIFWCQIQTAPVTEKECPNDFSYILGDKCYSLHTEYEFNYYDSVEYCEKYKGTLWSDTSKVVMKFLRKIQAKQGFLYWIGAHEKGHNWKYLSDDSLVSESLIKTQKHRQNQCLAIKHDQHKMKSLPCKHNLYTVCEYTDEICQIRKDEGKTCYEFTNTEEDFNKATITCTNLEARIVEVRNQHQLEKLQKTIRQDKAFENITDDKLDKLDGSRFPILWHLKQVSEDENACLIYENSEIKTTVCTGISRNFACKFDAIPKTITSTTGNALPTLPDEGLKEKLTVITDHDDIAQISTTTTTLIIIMVIMIVILVVAIAFLVYRLYRVGNRENGNQGEENRPLQPGQ